MLKKMVILGVVGFVAVSALGGTKLASYIRSELREARERAESNIPPEKEVARLRNELKLLDKDLVAVINELAKQRVAVNDLQSQTEDLATKQATSLKALKDRGVELKARAEALKNAQGHVTFGNRTVNLVDANKELESARSELEQDANRYKSTQKSLESMQALLANRVKVRDSLEKQLVAMKAQKAELTAAVDDMEAQLAALKLQQMESKYQTDDTRLAKIKEDLRVLKTKVDVEREKLKLMPIANESAPAAGATKSVDDILGSLEPTKPAQPDAGKTGDKVPVAD